MSDLLDDLSASARTCLLESLGDEDLEAVLERPVGSEGYLGDDDVWVVLACIGPERARHVLLSVLVWFIQPVIQPEVGIVIGDEEMACLRESMADFDMVGMWLSSGGSPVTNALMSILGLCLRDALLAIMAADSGVEFEDLSESEVACLREWQAGVDWDGLVEAPEADEVFRAIRSGVLECLPEPPIGAPVSIEDDHADSEVGATPAPVGALVEGVVDYDGDVDLFVFEAAEGERYDLAVSPGTLEYLRIVLLDADRSVVAGRIGPDYFHPFLYWIAPSTGSFYVAVDSYALGFTGSYTLRIARSRTE